jgi:hypothetical protein
MTDVDRRREAAIDSLNAKWDFRAHAAVFVVANLAFVVGWFLTGPTAFFWPIWPFIGWGLGLSYHGWCVYAPRRPISEEAIAREIRKAA